MDGRLRRGRSGGHGAAHDDPAGRAGGRSRQPGRLRRRGSRRRGRHRRAARAACSTRITTPTASSSCRFGTPTNNTDDRRAAATADDPGARAQLRHRGRRPTRRRSTRSRTRCAWAPRSGCRRDRSRRCSGTSASAARAPRARHAQHEHRAVAGRLGLLPRQHDRLRRHRADARSPRAGRAIISSLTCAAAGRSRACAAAGSPTACCRSRRSTCGSRRPAEEPLLPRDAWLRGLLMKLRDNVWRPRLGEAFASRPRAIRPIPMPISPTSCAPMRSPNGYSARAMLGRHYLQHLRAFLGEDLAANGFIAAQDALAAGILQRLGIPWRPRLARAACADMAWPVDGAAGAGRRSVAVARISSRTTSPRCSRQPTHRRADRRAPRSGVADRNATSLLQTAAAPCAAARDRRRRGADRRERAGRRPAARCCAMPS